MPASFSDFAREELVKYIFTTESLATRPTTWFVALALPGGDEVSGTEDPEYARQAVTFEDYSVTGRRRNVAEVNFDPAGTNADYTVRFWEIWTAASGGSRILTKRLVFDRPLLEGQAIQFGAGDLIVGAD